MHVPNPPISDARGRDPFRGAAARRRRGLWLVLVLAAALAAVRPRAAQSAAGDASLPQTAAAPIIFSAIGDVPYSDSELPTLEQHVTRHNRYSPSEFFVHLGDIFSGSTPCDEYRYSQVADVLKQLAVPAFMCPGDNETSDCADQAQGWLYWTRYFMRFEENFCGTLAVERQGVRPENFAFVSKGVLFVGINLVGGTNPSALQQDDADWVVGQLQQKVTQVRAAVIFAQAGPGSGRSTFFNRFEPAAAAFAKPILYVHGDGHSWIDDRPLAGAQNVRRIQVERGTKPPIQVTVTMDPLFQVVRDPWPSGTPVYNMPPCVNAGSDQTIALAEQAWLQGMATDDGDPSGTLSLLWSQVSGPGSVTFTSPNAAVTFAAFSAAGTYTLQLRASDGALASVDPVNVTVTGGTGVNDLPVAEDDAYQVLMQSALTVPAPGILGNDTDPDGDAMTAVLVSGVAHGSLALAANGSFTYTPDSGWYGNESFTYRAVDGRGESPVASVTIGVSPLVLTLAPLADASVNSASPNKNYGDDDKLRVEVDSSTYYSFLKFQVTGVGTSVYRARLRLLVTNAGDDGGSAYAVSNLHPGTLVPWTESDLTWQNAPAIGGAPLASVGTVEEDEWAEFDVTSRITGDGVYSFGIRNASLHSVEFTSKEGADPPQLLIETRPGGGAADATPNAGTDAYALDEDAPLGIAAPGLLANDTDADGDALTAAALDTPPAHGSVTLSADGSFTYTPATDYNGPDSFTYGADDNRGALATGSVTLTVRPVNDPPVVADEAYDTDEDTAVARAAPGVLANDTDIDGGALAAAPLDSPDHGTLGLGADGSFTYTPEPDFNGADSFTYVVTDGAGGSAIGRVTIAVAAVQDAPRATLDRYTTAEDETLAVAAPGVLANDRDPEGDAMTASLASAAVHGTVTLGADGAFVYIPPRDFAGTDSFTYAVSDTLGNTSTASVTIFVGVTDDPPVAIGEAYSTDEDVPLVVTAPGVLANDSDADGDPLAAFVTSGPAHGSLVLAAEGGFTYTPHADFHGADSFSYRVTDPGGTGAAATTTLDVRSVNDPPVTPPAAYAVPEDSVFVVAAPGLLAGAADADGDPLTAALVSGAAHGTVRLDADGGFAYTPAPDFNGTDAFDLTVSDGHGGVTPARATLTVNPVNDPPVASGESYATDEDVNLVVPAPGLLANDADVDGDPLAIVLVAGPAHGTVSIAGDGGFAYAPALDFNGSDSFTYRIADGRGGTATATTIVSIRAVNDAPVATAEAYTTLEHGTLTVGAPGVLVGDTDVDGDMLTAVLAAPPLHGTLSLQSDGAFTYVPAPDFNGGDAFTYSAQDGRGGAGSATVTIGVTPANDPPVAAGEVYASDEDETLTIAAPGVLANDLDADGDRLTALPLGGPGHGTLTLAADGAFTYVPVADFNGTDTFTYQVQDGAGGSATATVTLIVRPVNDNPVVTAVAYTTNEDVVLNVAAPGVLGNAVDAEGDSLTATLVTPPQNGTIALQPDGSFTYAPPADFHGIDSFTFTVSDRNDGATTAASTITVLPMNDAPTAASDAYATDEDATLAVPAPGVLANDTDADGDGLGATVVTGPAHGALVLQADGSFTYVPAPDFDGTDSFTYRVADGHGASAVGTAAVTVRPMNDAPVVLADAYTTREDTELEVDAPGVLGNDRDGDGDVLAATIATRPAHGALHLDASGSFTYTPAPDYYGPDAFTYTVVDGKGGSTTGSVTLSVTAVNDVPVATSDAYTTTEEVGLLVGAPGVLANDVDAEGDALAAARAAGPAHGTLVLGGDGSFTYTPAPDFSGIDSFTYTVRDSKGGSAEGTVSITVAGAEDAPKAVNDAYRTDEDVPLVVGGPGILGNDTDADGDSLTAALTAPPGHGSLQLDATGGFTYTPAPDWNGNDGFAYEVSDGRGGTAAGSVSIHIDAVNDLPRVADAGFSGREDEPLVVVAPGVLSGASDRDGDVLAVALGTGPAHGTVTLAPDGGFTYTPAADFNGTDGLTFTASDGHGGSATAAVTLTIAAVEDAPVAVDDAQDVQEDGTLTVAAPGLLGNDRDADGDALTATPVALPDHGSLDLRPDGSLTYVPAANFNGTDSFTYIANDGHGPSAPARVTLSVAAVNDFPEAHDDTWSIAEDAPLAAAAPGVLGNDTDADGDALASALLGPPAHGTLDLHPDGSFNYVPRPDFHGADRFTYAASDGHGGTHEAVADISVTSVNDAPIVADDAFGIPEEATLTVAAPGLLQNDADVDGDALTVSPAGLPGHGTLTLSADGGFTYTPAPDFYGEDSFTYAVLDGAGGQTIGTVAITVLPVNDAPVAANDAYGATEDVELAVAAPGGVLGNDVDPDADVLLATLTRGARHGRLVLHVNGGFVYTPDPNFAGPDGFDYAVNDGNGGTSAGSVAITVAPVNDAPNVAADASTLEEDGTLAVVSPGVLGNDSDVEGDALTASVAVEPAHGVLHLNADGAFTYAPLPDYSGPDQFTYAANDGQGGVTAGTVTITVSPVNDAPVALSDSLVVRAGGVLELGAPGLLANDHDADGDSLRLLPGTLPTFGALALGAYGSLTYTPAPGFTGIEHFTYRASDGTATSAEVTVTLRVEGRGVTFRETARGAGVGVIQVSTATPIAAVEGDLYLAAVSTYPRQDVLQVAGLGLVWHRVGAQCGARDETGVEVWSARGEPTAGLVTASFSQPAAQAVLLVSRYSGADGNDPIGSVIGANTNGLDGGCTGGASSDAYAVNIPTLTQGGIVFGAIAMREREHEPGSGAYERAQSASGAGEATAGLAIVDRAVDVGEHALSGRFDTAVDWALVGVEIRSNTVPDAALRWANLVRIHPNPFNAAVSIEYNLYRRAQVRIAIYDVRGTLVRRLLDSDEPPGGRALVWDARDDRRMPMASGVYFARVELEGHTAVRKLVLTK